MLKLWPDMKNIGHMAELYDRIYLDPPGVQFWRKSTTVKKLYKTTHHEDTLQSPHRNMQLTPIRLLIMTTTIAFVNPTTYGLHGWRLFDFSCCVGGIIAMVSVKDGGLPGFSPRRLFLDERRWFQRDGKCPPTCPVIWQPIAQLSLCKIGC